MDITRFATPWCLWLLLLLPVMVVYYVLRRRKDGASIQVSATNGVAAAPRTLRYWMRHLPFALRFAVVGLVIIAIARPQSKLSGSNSTREGIDIVLALDVSSSMLSLDFNPNRIEAAKEVAKTFISDRPNDRIGLVIFASESFTQCPLTTDKSTLLNLLNQVHIGMVDDGTAIGNGLATAVNRLKDSESKSRVIILLTDGVNNAGQITPVTAADIAATYGIKVYTVGVGTNGVAQMPVVDIFGRPAGFQPGKVEIDEDMLKTIATKTSGEYFRATDNNSLKAIYDKINGLERSKVEVTDYSRYNELYGEFLLLAIALLALELITRHLIIRQIP